MNINYLLEIFTLKDSHFPLLKKKYTTFCVYAIGGNNYINTNNSNINCFEYKTINS